jgi:large subunit ribosomal protein L29
VKGLVLAMDIDKVRALTDGELRIELATERRHLYDLRFQLATRQLTDHTQLTQTRRSIARVLTVMTERNLEPYEVAPPAPARRARRTSTRAAAKPTDKTAAKTAATTTPRGGKS